MGNTKAANGALTATRSPTQTVKDLQAGYDRIEEIGGLVKKTSGERTQLTSGEVSVGWLIAETDTGNLYMRTAQQPQGLLVYSPPKTAEITDFPNGVVWDTLLEARGDRVTIDARVNRPNGWGTFDAAMLIGKVPAGFRPVRLETFIGGVGVTTDGNTFRNVNLYILSNGNITLRTNGFTDMNVIGFQGEWRRA